MEIRNFKGSKLSLAWLTRVQLMRVTLHHTSKHYVDQLGLKLNRITVRRYWIYCTIYKNIFQAY